MDNKSIIKWRILWTNIWFAGFLYLVTYIAEHQIFGTYYTAWIWGGFLILFGLYYYWKVRLFDFIIMMVVLGTGSWHYEAAMHMNTVFSPITIYIHLILLITLLFICMPRMVRSYKLEIHARKLFRLAAEGIMETANGYTSRPWTSGKKEIDSRELAGLARYLGSKEVVTFDIANDRTVLFFSMNTSPLKRTEAHNLSYIAVDDKGILSVNISARDYRQFNKKYSFDQLCKAFVDLFKRFNEYYKNGHEEKIISELKSV